MKNMAIGLMSGTSLDGVDAVIAEIGPDNEQRRPRVLHAVTYPYPEVLRKKIHRAISQKTSTSKLICSLNHELAETYAECVFAVCRDAGIRTDDVAFIASHGQTVFHIASEEEGFVPSSLQLGDGSVLACLTGITVVSNFRPADIAAGGSGAPLVPYADVVLFRHPEKNRLLQNIGGISNVTCVPADASLDEVFAFDNGPGNMMIDRAMERLYGKPFDCDGAVAKRGNVAKELLAAVMKHPYFKEKPPKSTGREMFGIDYTDALIDRYGDVRPEDVIATLTEVTAQAIIRSYDEFILPRHEIAEVIVSGGGAKNNTLMNRLNTLSARYVFSLSDEHGVPGDHKEALAFIILAYETLHHRPSNVPGATGAEHPVILGQVSPALHR